MPKKGVPPTIGPQELKQAIEKGDDFGHEMRICHIVEQIQTERRKDAYNATDVEILKHGGSYTDPLTNKFRQFDFRCRITKRGHEGRPNSGWSALLAIECKNLHESSPLVVCGRPRTAREAYYAAIESRKISGSEDVEAATKRVETEFFYEQDKFVGKSLARIGIKNGNIEVVANSEVYDGWSQAVNSCIELAQAATGFADSRSSRFLTLVFPVVVVPDGSLWEVEYNDEGTIETNPRRSDHCEYFVETKFEIGALPFVLTHVHFVTLRGLSELLSRFWKHRNVWEWIFPPILQDLVLEAL